MTDTNERTSRMPDWMASASRRKGPAPRGFKISSLEFGSSGQDGAVSSLERLGLDELVYATIEDNVDLKANHIEPGVLTGMLAETMSKIEEKYASGTYDAAAVPLVEQYLAEMRIMALIQTDRSELIAERIADVKEANEKARAAVYDARTRRAQAIRDSYVSVDAMRERKMRAKLDAKEQRQQWREQKANRKEERRRSRDEARDARHQRKDERRERKLQLRNERRFARRQAPSYREDAAYNSIQDEEWPRRDRAMEAGIRRDQFEAERLNATLHQSERVSQAPAHARNNGNGNLASAPAPNLEPNEPQVELPNSTDIGKR